MLYLSSRKTIKELYEELAEKLFSVNMLGNGATSLTKILPRHHMR